MADYALRVVTPLSVTGQALSMIGTFETGLPQVVGIRLAAVAFSAGRDVAGRAIVVTDAAAIVHFGHTRVPLVIEVDGLIGLNEFIDQKRIRRFDQRMT